MKALPVVGFGAEVDYMWTTWDVIVPIAEGVSNSFLSPLLSLDPVAL
ncbi:hypothetical protein [Rubripirellula tenax]|nr:hypothetical protein [Rubripirellula tenax]